MHGPNSLFLGHGAPTLALSTHPAAQALIELGLRLPRPKAVVVISPHRQAASFEVGVASQFHAWHDFRGFAPELYALRYNPPGAPELAQALLQTLAAAGLPSQASDDARIDHGIWVPLRLMWPQADIPVVPVAITEDGPDAHLALGRALSGLAAQDVMVIGSGSITHNLSDLNFADEFAPAYPWAQTFDDWVARHLLAGDAQALCAYRSQAPEAIRAHPTEEHLMPLFVALGARGTPGHALYRGMSYGSVSLSAYHFGP
ncbi:MAG: DODA-type extradiol aromatic ring-opening family dioxygenase [Panacagrimonas sp.]